ncbi:14671_t:CDS:2, partial [Funneliformis caledonium]
MVNKVKQPHNDNSDTELEGSKVRSWIWKYFEPGFKEGVRYAVCQVEIIVGKKCEKTYKVDTSTSNCSEHLANIHGITKEQKEADI